ncbi:MAG TPA: hypothetical protein VM782_06465, partial [Stellaceae bacterium]|nr:hypothetical protein [Stellaceae bacterium]
MFGLVTDRPQLGAQAVDDDVDRSIRRRPMLAIERLGKSATGLDLPGIGNEVRQQQALRGGEVHCPAVRTHNQVLVWPKNGAGEFDGFGLARSLRSGLPVHTDDLLQDFVKRDDIDRARNAFGGAGKTIILSA